MILGIMEVNDSMSNNYVRYDGMAVNDSMSNNYVRYDGMAVNDSLELYLNKYVHKLFIFKD